MNTNAKPQFSHRRFLVSSSLVAAMKKEGRTLEEVVAAKPTADYDTKWDGFVIKGDTFTSFVYAGV